MKKIILLLALSLSTSVFSQSNGKTFTLKNGSVITGQVVEEVPGKTYKVKTSDGNIFVFKADEIEKITLAEGITKTKKKQQDELEDGKFYYNLSNISLAGIFGDGESGVNAGLETIHGINLNNKLSIGVGTEIQLTSIGTYIPVFADLRLNFSKTKRTYFIHLNPGFVIANRRQTVPLANGDLVINYRNGYMARLGLGYKMPISNKLNASLGLFFSSQSYEAGGSIGSATFKTKGNYSIVGLKFGLGIN